MIMKAFKNSNNCISKYDVMYSIRKSEKITLQRGTNNKMRGRKKYSLIPIGN